MEQIFEAQIINNNQVGHRDLIFGIAGLFANREFDSYYFSIAIEPNDTIQDLRNALATLFSYWITEAKQLPDNHSIFLPIDFSDQYTGCLKVVSCGPILQLTYGYSEREGFTVNPLDPGDYSTSVTDFKDTENKTIEVLKSDFLSSLKEMIDRLQNGR